MAAIRSLRFANFKSWADPEPLRLGAITGLFGTNSSGKSSIIQLLLLLKQTAESLDRTRVLHLGDDKSLIDLGTFYDLIYAHDVARPLDFGLAWSLDEPLTITDPKTESETLLSATDLSFFARVLQEGAGDLLRLVVNEFFYTMNSSRFGMRRVEDTARDYELISERPRLKRRPMRPWPLPPPLKSYGFPDQVANYFQNADFLSDLALALERLMSEVSYIGPLRENPHRIYLWSGERPASVGERGELAVEALLAARSENRKIGRGTGKGRRYFLFETVIARWLQEMGLIESFAVRAIGRNRKEYEVRVRKTAASAEVLITDVGFGVSQVLPILVQCYYAAEGSLIIFEQPEIHLHPLVQATLADVFIEAARERRVQILVESHSEHLLRRLQRRIAEGAIESSDVALYFTRFSERKSVLEPLDIDVFGNIANWPQDFFGDEIGELAAMTSATAERVAS